MQRWVECWEFCFWKGGGGRGGRGAFWYGDAVIDGLWCRCARLSLSVDQCACATAGNRQAFACQENAR